MNKNSPYFSLSGLCFQTPGDEVEQSMNIQIAMDKLRAFVLSGGGEQDAMVALTYLEDQYPRLEHLCDDMRIAFILDDFDDMELKKRIATRAYNRIVDRMNGRPV